MRVVLRREAERELISAAQHYESVHPGLGAEFLDEAEKACAELAEFPRQWRVVHADVRRGLLWRFPFAFYYWEKVPGVEVEILSFAHTKRRPLHWISRRR